MCFFDFVQNKNRMRMTHNRIGKQSALIKTDISRRRTDEARNRVRFGVFAHIVAQKFHAENFRKLFGNFGFSNSGRTAKQKRADGRCFVSESGA